VQNTEIFEGVETWLYHGKPLNCQSTGFPYMLVGYERDQNLKTMKNF